jgi:hypothetical protein
MHQAAHQRVNTQDFLAVIGARLAVERAQKGPISSSRLPTHDDGYWRCGTPHHSHRKRSCIDDGEDLTSVFFAKCAQISTLLVICNNLLQPPMVESPDISFDSRRIDSSLNSNGPAFFFTCKIRYPKNHEGEMEKDRTHKHYHG